jgi:hypothetical protein
MLRDRAASSEEINELSRALTINHLTLAIALFDKGVVSESDLELARPLATSMVDQEWAQKRQEFEEG